MSHSHILSHIGPNVILVHKVVARPPRSFLPSMEFAMGTLAIAIFALQTHILLLLPVVHLASWPGPFALV